MGLDIGGRTKDRKEIAEKVIEIIREGTKSTDRKEVVRVMERTRVIVLGKETETRTVNQKVIETIPILLDCRSETDRTVIENTLRGDNFLSTTGLQSA